VCRPGSVSSRWPLARTIQPRRLAPAIAWSVRVGDLAGQLGIAYCLAGLFLVFLGWNGAATYDRVSAQLPYLISGGVAGLCLVVIGGSLALRPYPIAEVRAICDTVGATLLFDAAHLCLLIAGGALPDPLAEGAHVMTMSTYKSLGGPPGGLVVTSDAGIAAVLDGVAFPGLTANNDLGRVAALAVALNDCLAFGKQYAIAAVEAARALARALDREGLPVAGLPADFTSTHHVAVDARAWGGGTAAAGAAVGDAVAGSAGVAPAAA